MSPQAPQIACLVVYLLLTAAPNSFALPIFNLIGESDGKESHQGYLTVQTSGREQATDFSNIQQLIANGAGQTLALQATSVLALHPRSSLAFESLGVGNLMQGNFVAAIENFENAAKLDPSQGGIYAKLGLVLMETDELDAAEKAFQSALQANPNDTFSHRNLGLLYDYTGRPNLAIKELRQGLSDTDTGFIFEAVTLARLLNDRREYDLAINVLERRIPESMENEAAQTTLATALLGAERWEAALTRFDRALELNPNIKTNQLGRAVALRGNGQPEPSIDILQSLANDLSIARPVIVELTLSLLGAGRGQEAAETRQAAIDMGVTPSAIDESMAGQYLRDRRFEEARSIYQTLVNRQAGSALVYVNLSELLFAEGLTDDSLTVLTTGQQRFPTNAYLAYRLGSTYASLGSYNQAIPELTKAAQLSPESRDILRSLSLAHTRAGNHTAALEPALSILAVSPNDQDTLVFVALAYERTGDAQNTINMYNRVLAINPNNALVHNNLAYALVNNGDVNRAAEHIDKAVALIDSNPLFLDTLGFVRLQQNQHQAAVKALERATNLSPELAVAHYHLGMAYNALNQTPNAWQAFQRALSLAPESSWAPDATRRMSELPPQ